MRIFSKNMTKPKITTTRKPSMTAQAQAGVIHGRNSNLDKQTEQWDADLKVFDQEWDNLFLDTFMLNNGEPEPTPETNSNDDDGEHKKKAQRTRHKLSRNIRIGGF
jgi:hypothetical protein